MSESYIAVSPTGSAFLRVVSGSLAGFTTMDEVIQLAEPINRGRIDPRNINLTGSIISVTGSSITNTQPVGITGSITQATTPWQVTYTGSQPVTFTTPIGVTQSTTPWTIGGTVNLTGSNIITGSLTSGSFVNAFITNPTTGGANPVAITGSTVGPVANITGSVYQLGTWTISQGTSPWLITGSSK